MSSTKSKIGLIGLAVMGQNLSLNFAQNGINISVYNRSYDKTEATVARAKEENLTEYLTGYQDLNDFIQSIEKPRPVIMMIQAGAPVDQTIAKLLEVLEPGDIIIDGGNEWYLNTEARSKLAAEKNIQYVGMGVSGGELGARYGPSIMPGGPIEAYNHISPWLKKIAAKTEDGSCVTYIGPGGAGNYVKMIHNGIEYGDMQLIAEAYDILKNIGGLTNEELAAAFDMYNANELQSYLIEITAQIFKVKDEDGQSYVVDKILDKTGQKGTGRWTIQEAAQRSICVATMSSALDVRYLSSLLNERVVASTILQGPTTKPTVDKQKLIDDVRKALYAAKICSYTQGMNVIRQAGIDNNWNLNLGAISQIWKGGCIIRAKFLDRIKSAYDRNPALASLLIDSEFASEMNERQQSLREIVMLAIGSGISVPSLSASLWYYDTYRRARLPANLTQAQRDFFGAHTYERTDKPGSFHTEWSKY